MTLKYWMFGIPGNLVEFKMKLARKQRQLDVQLSIEQVVTVDTIPYRVVRVSGSYTPGVSYAQRVGASWIPIRQDHQLQDFRKNCAALGLNVTSSHSV